MTLLGPVTVFQGEQEMGLGSPRQRTLFAILAAHANQVISREELVAAVWGPEAPATAMNSVYTYVARLRHRLEPARPRRAPSDLLVSDSRGYMLQLAPDQVDVKRFEVHLKQARALRGAQATREALTELDAALALWRGIPYGGVSGPFAEAERRYLAELRLTAIEDRIEMLYELDHGSDIGGELSDLTALVRRNPLRERLRHLLMIGYVRFGRQAEAVTEYHDLRTRLAEEQGLEPGERIQRFYEEILRSGPSVRPSPPKTAAESTVLPIAPAQLARDVPDFTGRAGELQQLHEMVKAAESTGESAVILVNGAPGIGKTALAVRLAHALSWRFPDGQLQLDLRGYGEKAGPAEPEEALQHLLEALGAVPPADRDLERQRTLFRSLVAGRRLLILLDNAVSVQQVRPLLPGDASCLVIVTSRNGLAGLTVRDGARRITLDGMAEEDGVELLGRLVGRPLVARDHPAARQLVNVCGGLPLALRIAATRIGMFPSPEHGLSQCGEGDLLEWLEVLGDEQSSLKTVFDWSYRALPDEARRMFRMLGAGPKPRFTLRSAATLADATPWLARRWLDVLVEANLVQEPVRDNFRLNPLIFAYARHVHRLKTVLHSTRAMSG
ncbi:BTAD domain-containing putative transcriptional regulator [Streptomyces sp. NPDC058773]|uniref:AfsR/SARP family transcriptional regulator n=1 Tax=Streptomyces sp. NPDC058773 TaxID=3346632 RepID=UPI0036833942